MEILIPKEKKSPNPPLSLDKEECSIVSLDTPQKVKEVWVGEDSDIIYVGHFQSFLCGVKLMLTDEEALALSEALVIAVNRKYFRSCGKEVPKNEIR